MIARIQRIPIPVADQERAKRFYVDVLGLELVNDVTLGAPNGARWVEVAPAKGSTTLLLVRSAAATRTGCAQGLMLETPDLDAEARRLRALGVTVESPRQTPWGRELTLRDPDGNGLALLESQPAGPYHTNWLAWRYATPLGEDDER